MLKENDTDKIKIDSGAPNHFLTSLRFRQGLSSSVRLASNDQNFSPLADSLRQTDRFAITASVKQHPNNREGTILSVTPHLSLLDAASTMSFALISDAPRNTVSLVYGETGRGVAPEHSVSFEETGMIGDDHKRAWHFLTLVFEGLNVKLYMDCKLVGAETLAFPFYQQLDGRSGELVVANAFPTKQDFKVSSGKLVFLFRS